MRNLIVLKIPQLENDYEKLTTCTEPKQHDLLLRGTYLHAPLAYLSWNVGVVLEGEVTARNGDTMVRAVLVEALARGLHESQAALVPLDHTDAVQIRKRAKLGRVVQWMRDQLLQTWNSHTRKKKKRQG